MDYDPYDALLHHVYQQVTAYIVGVHVFRTEHLGPVDTGRSLVQTGRGGDRNWGLPSH